MHSTLALTPSGQPLGLLHARSWARSTRGFGRSAHARNRTPREQKESQKWLESLLACPSLAARCPQTTLVNLADREGDLYTLFQQALAPTAGGRMHLLVRAQHDRQVVHPQKYLWDYLAAQRASARLKLQVPRKDGQPARLATLTIRFASVRLRPPCLKEDQPSLSLWAVEARETRPPKGIKAICWRLLPPWRWRRLRRRWRKSAGMRNAGRLKCSTKCSRAAAKWSRGSWRRRRACSGC